MSRLVVITGASSGIGRELALLCGANGDELILTARRRIELERTAADSGAAKVGVVCGDITDSSVWGQIAEDARGSAAELILVNNAGLASFGGFAEESFSTWERQIQVNLVGPFGLTHALIPLMLERGRGRVVNILSIVLKHPLPGAAGYAASKAGLEAMNRCLAAEHRRQGISFTNIYPGATDTPIWDSASGHPSRDQMIPVASVAQTIFEVLNTPRDRVLDEVVITPPDGIL